MVVGTLQVSLRLDGCRSLKDKRHLVRGLLERLRREFQVAAAEVDDHGLWGNAEIGIACVSASRIHAESILQHAVNRIEASAQIEVAGVAREFCDPSTS